MSNSEKSYGSRLDHAVTIHAQLEITADYSPISADLTTAAYGALIGRARQTNTDFAFRAQEYSAAIILRKKLFTSNDDSLYRMALQISAAVQSSFGKNAPEYKNIQAMAKKIRGVTTYKKPKKNVTADDTPFISQSERSYGNMAKILEDMLTTLEGHGAMYNATGDLSLASLREKSILLNSTNKDVATKYGLLKIIRAERELVYQLFQMYRNV